MIPLVLLSPLALLFLAAVPVIVLFYILRARYERIEVPSTLLWRNVIRDTEGRPTWRPPIRNILLLLQLLFAIVGAFALSRPATLGHSARYHIVILDASGSMQATDVQPSRFEDAKRLASEVLRGGQDGDAFALIRMGGSVDLIEAGDNAAQVIQALGALQPSVTGGDVRAALQVAGSLARERPGYRSQVTLVSDGTFGELPPIESGVAEVRVQTVGSSSDNQAIVNVRVRRSFDGSNRYEGFARLYNYAPTPVEVQVRALADSIQVDAKRLTLRPRQPTEYIVSLSATVKLFEVVIDRTDALMSDNYAQVVVPSEDVDVTLVSGTPASLERALRAVPNVKLTVIRPQQYKRESVGAITVFEQFIPRGRENLPAGSMLVVNPPPGTNSGFEVGELKQAQQIVRINPRSPLLESVDLTGVFLPKALRLAPPPGSSPVVESREAGLVWEGVDEGRKLVVFAFDPRQPEIGQRLAFPLMLANAIGWLSPNTGSATISPGQTFNLQPLRDAKDVVVRDPSGKSYVFPMTAANRGRAIPFVQTDLVGRYAVVQRGEKGALAQSWFTVNAGDEAHSDIRPRTFQPQVAATTFDAIASAVSWEMWPLLAALGLGVLAVEWLVYVRR
ncbi:MAG TPA: VWA domain-containing protein [Chloroflexota bacterium]|nr:VWA domain-containing protein [Chloroflexota bacterium]